MNEYRWLIYALLSAFSAASIGIFAKLGMNKVDSTFATAVRSLVMSAFLVCVVQVFGMWGKAKDLQFWPMMSIILSGLAGAVSWLFYFKAIQLGAVSKVAPIDKLSMPFAILLAVLILGEKYTPLNWLGVGLIVGGAYLTTMK
jgi:transporter family protein